jgi:prevent-host-death family protein
LEQKNRSMKIAPVAEVKAQFSAYLRESKEGPVVVTKNGRPVAVLLSVEDEDEVERLVLAYSSQFQATLQAAKNQIREGSGIRHEDFWREVEAEAEQSTPV